MTKYSFEEALQMRIDAGLPEGVYLNPYGAEDDDYFVMNFNDSKKQLYGAIIVDRRDPLKLTDPRLMSRLKFSAMRDVGDWSKVFPFSV
ncbi:MAG: hypothetical protein Q4G21_09565 [Dermabacter sp.]|nr:hypothetical protein [Dermabacter sp.]